MKLSASVRLSDPVIVNHYLPDSHYFTVTVNVNRKLFEQPKHPVTFCLGGIVANSDYSRKPYCFDKCHLVTPINEEHSFLSSSSSSEPTMSTTMSFENYVGRSECFEIQLIDDARFYFNESLLSASNETRFDLPFNNSLTSSAKTFRSSLLSLTWFILLVLLLWWNFSTILVLVRESVSKFIELALDEKWNLDRMNIKHSIVRQISYHLCVCVCLCVCMSICLLDYFVSYFCLKILVLVLFSASFFSTISMLCHRRVTCHSIMLLLIDLEQKYQKRMIYLLNFVDSWLIFANAVIIKFSVNAATS